MLEPLGWVVRKKRRVATGESGVKIMGERKEIEDSTLVNYEKIEYICLYCICLMI